MLKGKKGIVMGVANERSLAWAISKELYKYGADIGFSHLPDKDERKKTETKLRRLTEEMNPKLIAPCNVGDDGSVKEFFDRVKEVYGNIDFLVHSIAYADIDEIKRPVYQVTRPGFAVAMDVSVYSFLSVVNAASSLFNENSAVLTMTYYGGEKVVNGYNLMGVCKAALDSCIKYLAANLGEKHVRVNGISAGPVRTLAASAVKVDSMQSVYSDIAPLGRNILAEEVGKTAVYLLGDLSSAVTGEIVHVDCGYNIMGSFGKGMEE